MKNFLIILGTLLLGIGSGSMITDYFLDPEIKIITKEVDTNATLTYGESGFPKNCRAIIKANIDGYKNGNYEAFEALDSIDRNCGANGYSW